MKAGSDRKGVTDAANLQIVVFQVGAESFGLDINAITEVIRPLPITALPHMPRFVRGVINLRGVIIPIVDLRERFGRGDVMSSPRTMRMIITRGTATGPEGGVARLLGLVVESVQEVVDIPSASIGPAPEGALGDRAEFISGVARQDERLIILIDVSRILSSAERRELSEAGSVNT